MPNWAFFLMRLTLGVGASALMTWGGNKLGGFAFALIGFVFSTAAHRRGHRKALVEMIHEGFGWLWTQPLRKWQGIYYEFNGMQIRVIRGR